MNAASMVTTVPASGRWWMKRTINGRCSGFGLRSGRVAAERFISAVLSLKGRAMPVDRRQFIFTRRSLFVQELFHHPLPTLLSIIVTAMVSIAAVEVCVTPPLP